MAISDFHASTIVRVQAYFGFDSFECDPDAITRFIGMQPDEVGRKGTVKTVRAGREIHWPFNSWSIASRLSSKDINEHLRELILRLTQVAESFPTDFGTPTFSVVWKSNYLYAGNGPFFEPDIIAGIARLNAALYQDIYQVDDRVEDIGAVTRGND
jgi:hypothetical protein